ncbi:MAG TPA: redox-active protein [Firmicutes bacterium]|jgi:C_GCAxxG_C_C family probable redox protein|nr:redox-active protein [Bacillota bacterium]
MKDYTNLINERVHYYYWNEDLNCATTVLKILEEIFDIDLNPQTVQAAIGLHGAGGFGAQCGLVEGPLMFIGIFGTKQGREQDDIIKLCHDFAAQFQKEFTSLSCGDLRPQGFKADNPPHLCEELTQKAVRFAADYIQSMKG